MNTFLKRNLIIFALLCLPQAAFSQSGVVIEESPDQQCIENPDTTLSASKVYQARCKSSFDFHHGGYEDKKQSFTLASNRLCDLYLYGVQLRSNETTSDPKVSKNTLSILIRNSALGVNEGNAGVSSVIYLKTTDKKVATILQFDIGTRALNCTLEQVK